jgi:hypothetical protein
MKSINRVKTAALFLFLLFDGCASLTPLSELNTYPNSYSIDVHTTDGSIYELTEWNMTDDGTVTGLTSSGFGISILRRNIEAVFVHDSPKMETVVTIAGSIAIASAVIGVLYLFKQICYICAEILRYVVELFHRIKFNYSEGS